MTDKNKLVLENIVAGLIAQGAIQLSRKYRLVGVPPELMPGQTYLDLLRKCNPLRWEVFENLARESAARSVQPIELSPEEFEEWLRQTGRGPAPR